MSDWRDDLEKTLETDKDKKARTEQIKAANDEYIQKQISDANSTINTIVQSEFPKIAARKTGMTMPSSGNGARIGLELANKSLIFEWNHGEKAIIITQNGTQIDRIIWNFHGKYLTSNACNSGKTPIQN